MRKKSQPASRSIRRTSTLEGGLRQAGKYQLLIVFVFNLILFVGITFSSSILQEYHNQLVHNISEIIKLEKQHSTLKNALQKLNIETNKLESQKNPSWFNRRKLVKTTEKKAELNQNVISFYQKLLELKSSANQIFEKYYIVLTIEIDSTISELENRADSTKRKNNLLYLLELKQRRDWLLNSQKYFTLYTQNIFPEDDTFLSLFINQKQKKVIQEDLIKILENKINQIELIIDAVKEEELLRKRFAQFSSEMTALSGETRAYQTNIFKESDRNEENITFFNTDFQNYAGLSDKEHFLQSETPMTNLYTEYLFLFQNIPSTNLPNYIAHLDSVRTSYLQTIKEIKKFNR